MEIPTIVDHPYLPIKAVNRELVPMKKPMPNATPKKEQPKGQGQGGQGGYGKKQWHKKSSGNRTTQK